MVKIVRGEVQGLNGENWTNGNGVLWSNSLMVGIHFKIIKKMI